MATVSVSASSAHRGVSVRLETAGQGSWEGVLTSVSPDGGEVFFSSGDAPAVAIGDAVALVVTTLALERAFQIDAVVQSRQDDALGRRYELEFKSDSEVVEAAAGLISLYNRRETFRVRPDAVAPIDVRVCPRGRDEELSLQLVDLSETGLGLCATDVAAGMVNDVDVVSLCFDLPGCARPLRAIGFIRHRRKSAKGVHIGIAFAPELTVGFDVFQDQIVAYVMRRQREVLRDLSGHPAAGPAAVE